MNRNEIIEQARKVQRLSYKEIADYAEMPVAAYIDVELYEEEIYTEVSLQSARKILERLNISFEAVYPEVQFWVGSPKRASLLRNNIIKAARIKKEMTQDQLGDLIGFEENVIKEMEENPDFLDGWPVKLITELASKLELCPNHLLNLDRF